MVGGTSSGFRQAMLLMWLRGSFPGAIRAKSLVVADAVWDGCRYEKAGCFRVSNTLLDIDRLREVLPGVRAYRARPSS